MKTYSQLKTGLINKGFVEDDPLQFSKGNLRVTVSADKKMASLFQRIADTGLSELDPWRQLNSIELS